MVNELKALVTTDPSDVIREPTGIPPHLGQSIKLQNLLEIATTCLELLWNQEVDVKQIRYERLTFSNLKLFLILFSLNLPS